MSDDEFEREDPPEPPDPDDPPENTPSTDLRGKAPWIIGAFLALGALCGCAGIGVGVLLYWKGDEAGEKLAERRAALSAKGHRDPFSAPEGAEVHINQSEAMGPRPMDERILQGQLRRDLGAPEKKDALPDEPWQLNLYQDPGQPAPNRAEIDLDRDGQLDELWKVEGTRVRRAVSTADDGDYDQMWLWQNGLWLKR